MKRIRLITLVLMIALIVALVSVSVFAQVTGNEKSLTTNIESLSPVEGATPNSTQLGGGGFELYNSGTYDIIKNEVDGNTYLNYHHLNNTAGGWVGNYNVRTSEAGKYKALDKYKYMTFDFDIWSPTGSMPSGTQVYFCIRAVNDNAFFGKEMRLGIGLNSDGSNYLYFTDDTSKKVNFDNSVWNHITFLLDTATNNKASWYVFLNGELVLSRVDALNGKLADLSTQYVETMRMIFANGNENHTTALDNLAINTYTTDYTDTSIATAIANGDITDWAHAVYTDDYVMPFASYKAELGGVKYESLTKAISDAPVGATIKLLADASSITVNKRVTIDPNGYSLGTVNAGTGLTVFRAGNLYKVTSNSVVDHGYLDFESVTQSGSYSASIAQDFGNNYTYAQKTDHGGTLNFITENGNKYLLYDWPESVVSDKSPYFRKVFNSTFAHSEVDYYTVDYDIWVPEGGAVTGISLYFCNRSGSSFSTAGNPSISFINSSGRVGLGASETDTSPVWLDANVWSHITVVVQVVKTTSSYTLNSYLYVDGEFGKALASRTGTALTDVITELRMPYPDGTSSASANAKVAYDNISVKTYKTAYDGTELDNILANRSSITGWSDNGYDESSVPYGRDVAELGGKKYNKLSDAVKDANNGDTITLLCDLNSQTIIDKRIFVNTAGYDIGTVSCATGFAYTVSGNIYVFHGEYTSFGVLDFESTANGTYDSEGDGVTKDKYVGLGSSYAYLYGQRKGVGSVIKPGTNKYFSYRWVDGATSNGAAYIYRSLADAPSNGEAPHSLGEFPLHVVDLDVYFPTGKVGDGVTLQFIMRYAKSSGYTFFHNANDALRIFYDDASGRNFIGTSATDTSPIYLDTDAWSHLTVALVATPNGTGFTTSIYVWVNGEYGKCVATDATTYSDMVAYQAQLQEVRINFPSSATASVTSNAEMAVDNINIRAFASTYSSNLEDIISRENSINGWYETAYDEKYVMPYGTSVASVGGVEYDSVAKAVANATSGDTITLLKNIVDPITVDKAITIATAGNTIASITGSNGYVVIKNADGSYSGVDAESADVLFEYVSGGKTVLASSTVTLREVLLAVDANTTIKFHNDYTVESSYSCADNISAGNVNNVGIVDKNITFDLGGNTFTLRGVYKDGTTTGNGQVCIPIKGGATLNVKNGTLVNGFTDSDRKDQSYSFFQFVANDATLNLTDVNTYVGNLVHNYGQSGVSVNVTGGEHHAIRTATGGINGWVRSYHSMNVTVNNASFYIESSSHLVSMVMRGTGRSASVVFNNCDIVAENKVVEYSDSAVTIEFNNCAISGNLSAPAMHASWETSGYTNGYITLGKGTVISGSYDATYVKAVADYTIYPDSSSKSISFHMSSGNQLEGFSVADSLTTKSYSFTMKVVESAIVAPVNVYWYDQNGSLIATTEVYRNAYAVPPTFTPTTITDGGYYKRSYDAWSKTAGGEAVESFLITGETSFYLTLGEVKPYLTSAMFNLKLMGHTQLNFYIPSALPSYVTLTGVYNSTGSAISTGATVKFDDVEYKSYVATYLGANNLHSDTVITVRYTVTVDGTSYELTQNVTISPLAYIKVVLDDYDKGGNKFEPTAYGICANLLRYSMAVHSYHGTTHKETKDLLEKYESALCDPIDNTVDTDFPVKNVVQLGDISTYIESVTFDINTYEPRFKIVFKDFYNDNNASTKYVTDMRIETIGYISGAAKGEYEANWGLQSYTYSAKWGVYHYDNNKQLVNASNGSVCDKNGVAITGTAGDVSAGALGVVYTQNIPIYNIDGDKTIILTLNDGTVVKGEYNIDTYYNGVKNTLDNETLLEVRYFLKAMREYSEAVQRYRFPLGMFPYVNKDEGIVSVKSFGAVGDGVTDDFVALKKAFDFANKMGYDVVFPEGTYYIGNSATSEIQVKTNVDFTKATFTLDDASVGVSSSARNKNIFRVDSDSTRTYDSATSPIKSLNRGATNIGWAPGYKALLVVMDNTRTHFIREGENSDGGNPIKEVILVDEDGNVDPSTPVIYDYNTITSLTVYSAEDETLTIKGGTFNTKANTAPAQYTYYNRGIGIQRSNVIVDGITHTISGEGDAGAPYDGFIAVRGGHNITIQNCTLQAHKAYDVATNSANTMGTYDISIGSSNAVTIKNVIQSNFFASDGTLTINGDEEKGTRYWGIMGTNETKNITVDGSTLSRVDAHRGVYNVNIINGSRIAHITLIGEGTFNLTDSEVYIGDRATAIMLRQDYGATWQGTFNIENTVIKYTNANITGVELVGGNHVEGHDFGYGLYLPETINVTNITTKRITRTGIADSTETVKATNEEKLAFYVSTNNSMGSAVTRRTCTSTININNCAGISATSSLILPNNRFFSGMKVYINGSQKSWSGQDTSSFNFGSTTGKDGSCLVEGTLITMADGSLKPIEELAIDDEILVFNHETGEYEAGRLWFTVHGELAREERTVLNLVFSDDTVIRIVHEHALFDSTLSKYVYLSVENREDYIGHEFLGVNGKVTLEGAYITNEAVKVYSPISERHLNVIAEGMITATTSLFDLNELINAYEYDENGVYLLEKRIEDIEKYGVYEYSEFAHLFSESEYNASPLYYLKAAVGKGLITRENIEALIKACVALGYMEGP